MGESKKAVVIIWVQEKVFEGKKKKKKFDDDVVCLSIGLQLLVLLSR